jgi:hypothetical protein
MDMAGSRMISQHLKLVLDDGFIESRMARSRRSRARRSKLPVHCSVNGLRPALSVRGYATPNLLTQPNSGRHVRITGRPRG